MNENIEPMAFIAPNGELRRNTEALNADEWGAKFEPLYPESCIRRQQSQIEELKADNFVLAQTVSELTTIRGSSTLVPDDKLAEMQAEIEKLRNWVEMLVEVPFFDEIDHYRGIPVSILRKAEEE